MKIRNAFAAMAWFAIALLCSAPAIAQRSAGSRAARRPVAARGRSFQRPDAGLPAAGHQLDRQPARLPCGAGLQARRREGGELRRHRRQRTHAGRPGAAHGDLREPAHLEDRLPHLARPRRGLCDAGADAVCATGAHDRARPPRGVAGAGRHQAADGGGAERCAAGLRQLLAGDPGADRRRAGAQAGAGPFALPAHHQHQGADPAGRPGPEVLPARLRRLARSRCPRRAVDAVDGAADRHGPRRGGDRQDRRRRHARRRHQRPAQALARQRCADDLHQPGAGRADRLQGPAGLRADRRHATAVGRQHEQRRTDRHRQQQLLRADGGPLVPRCRPVRPVELRAERRAAGGLRAHSATGAGRGRAADGGGHAAGAGSGDLELDPADGDGAAEERPEHSRRASTAHRSSRRSPAPRCRMWSTRRNR